MKAKVCLSAIELTKRIEYFHIHPSIVTCIVFVPEWYLKPPDFQVLLHVLTFL